MASGLQPLFHLASLSQSISTFVSMVDVWDILQSDFINSIYCHAQKHWKYQGRGFCVEGKMHLIKARAEVRKESMAGGWAAGRAAGTFVMWTEIGHKPQTLPRRQWHHLTIARCFRTTMPSFLKKNASWKHSFTPLGLDSWDRVAEGSGYLSLSAGRAGVADREDSSNGGIGVLTQATSDRDRHVPSHCAWTLVCRDSESRSIGADCGFIR